MLNLSHEITQFTTELATHIDLLILNAFISTPTLLNKLKQHISLSEHASLICPSILHIPI